ncbi:MAG: CubicO group peptidase (beta-lactamase class C family) [Gammaproteobacteria bacterium]|jgi:CubicO group peptidase (beta-lactamase class C family)
MQHSAWLSIPPLKAGALRRPAAYNAAPMENAPEIHGTCHPRFDGVRKAFQTNFSRRAEHGAAFAVVLEGELVVDLWGGWQDQARTKPWQRDTLVAVQSTSKGFTATLFHWLVDQGHLHWSDRVATYWPEFSAKGDITIEQLISHQAGLCVVDRALPAGATLDWPQIIRALEAQSPVWTPGERFGYHAVTWSFLMGELAQRVSGETLPALFDRVFARPHTLDLYMGMPAHALPRVAQFLDPLPGTTSPAGKPTPYRERAFRVSAPPPNVGANDAVPRMAPGNGFGNARDIARFYGALSTDTDFGQGQLLSKAAAKRLSHTVVEGEDAVLGLNRRFGLGYWLHYPVRNAVRGPNAFGHPGLGGSFGLADPDRALGMAYTMNLPGAFVRAANLELAVYRSIRLTHCR